MPASGMNRSSITTSFEPVPRMPRVRQVSSTRTSGTFIGTPKCRTDRDPSSFCTTAPVIRMLPATAPEVNTLRAVMR